ncbi:MAG: ABC transporter ATP-binding protein [Chloroflexaceae bacterium]|nr:ABC transporter ATP-binding protein [Chloroflexaceae bacterium]
MHLHAEHVSWSVATQHIVDNVTLSAADGEFVGLLGPNGSGKSSLLRTIYRLLKPQAGAILLDDANVWQLSAREVARRMAVVTQEHTGDFDFSVFEMVLMGRNPHKGMFDRDTDTDFQLVQEALHRVDMASFARRSFLTLSGGEKQRVLIARALVQQARFLVLDEPTNHLDIHYQLSILELVRQVGVTTIAALHDLNLAAYYCDRLYVLKQGQVVESGTPEHVLRPDLIHEVYGVWSEIQTHPLTGKPTITFLPDSVGVHLGRQASTHDGSMTDGYTGRK